VLLDWPGEQELPQSFMFLASETRLPASAVQAMSDEQAARQREELNALYVAMTRARHRLVLSSVQPHQANEHSWWQRLQGGCEALTVTSSDDQSCATVLEPATSICLPVLPALTAVPSRAGAEKEVAETAALESLIGQAMHRLLEWAPLGAQACPEPQVQRAAREFGLDAAQGKQAAEMAQRILRGEGAWAWDATQIDWQGNEVAITVQGSVRRIDRLVRRSSGEWWVLDYKSAARPLAQDELVAQLRGYRAAVQKIYAGQVVRAAFLSAQGTLEEIESIE
jgi:ATP-dependent helicase/nuclease subunit A